MKTSICFPISQSVVHDCRMSRKLATVRLIGAIKPIKGADRIEIAVVDGWNCIVQKNQFSPGDRGVFFEIDSFLPASDARWAFLEKNFIRWNDQRGFRVRSIKMKGQISQGLLESLDKFPEIVQVMKDLEKKHDQLECEKLIREMSFEDIIGVQKWEAMDNTAERADKTISTPAPAFINLTDQKRI